MWIKLSSWLLGKYVNQTLNLTHPQLANTARGTVFSQIHVPDQQPQPFLVTEKNASNELTIE